MRYMTLVEIPLKRLRCGVGLRVAGVLLGVTMALPLAADPRSDVFQPDAFRTGASLRERTPGLIDPLGRDCPLPTSPLTLAAAVDIALCRNPATRTAWANAHLAAAALGSADSAWLPTIGGTDSESREHGPHVDVTGDIVQSNQNTNDAALNLSWTLYDFGNRGGRIRSARYLLDAAAATTNYTVQQTVFNVVQGYYGVVAGDAQLVAAQITDDTAEQSLIIARALHEGGAATLGDVLQAETAYDQAVLARVLAAQAAETARATLAVVIGVTADQPLKLDAQPVPAVVPALTARMADLMAQAMLQRPDLAAAREQRDSAIADITVARAAGRPSIAIAGSRNRIATTDEVLANDTTGTLVQNYGQIGVTLTVPLFTGFSVGYGVRQAQATLEIRDANVEQVRLQVSEDVWNGYYAVDSANKQLEATAALVKTAQSSLEVAEGRYKAGVGIFVELLTAQGAASAARQARITAEQNWEVARAQLALALGKLSGTEPLATAGGALQ